MDYVFKSRGLGKTTDIVKLCYMNKGIILVADEAHKKYILKCICPQLGLSENEIKVVSWSNLPREIIPKDTPIYIDEFEYLLEKIIGHKVAAISATL